MQDFQAEINAYDRVGASGHLANVLDGATTDRIQSPEDRFKIYVDAMSRKYTADGVLDLSETDINTMLDKTVYIPGLKYKNPIAYILGFVATRGGINMDHEMIMHVIRLLPKINEGGVEPADVVRYARYWVLIL